MDLPFTKMHGLGNDFMVINGIDHPVRLTADVIQKWSNRHFGLGFDQLLLVESPIDPAVDFKYRIFNADGSEVAQCGNGARCFAVFVRKEGLTDKTEIRVETNSGILVLRIQGDEQVEVDMGVPEFHPEKIPFVAEQLMDRYTLSIDNQEVEIGAVSVGNPHAVLMVNNIEQAPVNDWGPLIESHPRFPERVNAGFMQILDQQHVLLRVYERGAQETLACGSGACAAVAVGIQQGVLANTVNVKLPGGDLAIRWLGDGHPILMAGPATIVFEGTVKYDSEKTKTTIR